MGNLINRNELRRLEKAAREKDKSKLADWIKNFENYIDNNFRRDYMKAFQEELNHSIENIFTAVVYTLYYSEENYIDKNNLADFMADLFVSLDMFRTGEYTPEEYKDQLAEERVTIANYDSDMIYKKYLNIFDSDLVTYLKHKPRKIITIVGAKKYNDEIIKKYSNLCLQGNMVFSSVLDSDEIEDDEQITLDQLLEDEILISDILYVYNKDKYIGDTIQKYIDYAKQHNKEIEYLENI